MTEVTRTIPAKAHNVTQPDGTVVIVYAPTKQGAIAKAKAARKVEEETWSAELSTGEDLYLAHKNGTKILNPPPSIAEPDPQTDAFDDVPTGE